MPRALELPIKSTILSYWRVEASLRESLTANHLGDEKNSLWLGQDKLAATEIGPHVDPSKKAVH
jgi:hypothetical protein